MTKEEICENKECAAYRPCGCFQHLEKICKKFKPQNHSPLLTDPKITRDKKGWTGAHNHGSDNESLSSKICGNPKALDEPVNKVKDVKEFVKDILEDIEPLRYNIGLDNANRLKETIKKRAGKELI